METRDLENLRVRVCYQINSGPHMCIYIYIRIYIYSYSYIYIYTWPLHLAMRSWYRSAQVCIFLGGPSCVGLREIYEVFYGAYRVQ